MNRPASATFYAIRHITQFCYSAPIRENVMELRLHPLNGPNQHCHRFQLSVKPRTTLFEYEDHYGNVVHHFDIPRQHAQLIIKSSATVQIHPRPPIPAALPADSWTQVDELAEMEWDMVHPSRFTHPTGAVSELANALGVSRDEDPLTLVRRMNRAIYDYFDYVPSATRVDSPIDDAIAARRGVCQDFAHIMLTLLRGVGLPCRYVSGYLFRERGGDERSATDSSHAWVEVLFPEMGWVGFDPTNNLITNGRHIRTAVGRDYDDVSPTRGVFKGTAESELSVGVSVAYADAPPTPDEELLHIEKWEPAAEDDDSSWQQQQQQ